MYRLKILIVEDEEESIDVCRTTAARYGDEKGCGIDIEGYKTLQEALNSLDNSFDGAIIDLKLDDGNDGNYVIKEILSNYRIPMYVLTGTPYNVNSGNSFVRIGKKGEEEGEFEAIFDYFKGIYDTGLTRIFGGRGVIEETMDQVFWKNVFPQLETWKNYAQESTEESKTEKALLRLTVNHLHELLDDEDGKLYPEEMYISPIVSDSNPLRTGCVVSDISKEKNYVVMSPSCDLVLRNGNNCNTDRILICEIEDFDVVYSEVVRVLGSTNKNKIEKKIKEVLKNNYSNYYHWLPNTDKFRGGFINFRWLFTVKKEEFDSQFKYLNIQISSHFVKDIVSRFSSYYARQGQPDFAFKNLAKEIVEKKENVE